MTDSFPSVRGQKLSLVHGKESVKHCRQLSRANAGVLEDEDAMKVQKCKEFGGGRGIGIHEHQEGHMMRLAEGKDSVALDGTNSGGELFGRKLVQGDTANGGLE